MGLVTSAAAVETQAWKILRNSVQKAAKQLAKTQPQKRRPQFADALIVLMYLWCIWHNKPLYWACHKSHYRSLFRPRKLPSNSQFCRRIASERCQRIMQLVHHHLAQAHLSSPLSYFDGKPVLVSPVSKDPDARSGRVSGGYAKGYKLHVFATEDQRIPIWAITPLNTGECPVAEMLCPLIPVMSRDSLTLADTNYDSKNIGKALAQRGGCLLTPLKSGKKGQKNSLRTTTAAAAALDSTATDEDPLARHPVTLRQMGPVRRELLEVWKQSPDLARLVLKRRIGVENIFSQLDMTSPPTWVRGLARIKRWTGGKIILHHAKLQATAKYEQSSGNSAELATEEAGS